MDLAYYDREIVKREKTLLEARQEIDAINKTINICKIEKEGFFSVYSCKRNTGKTIDDWRDERSLIEKEVGALTRDLTTLRNQRAEAQKSIDIGLDIQQEQAKTDVAQSIASGELAQKYGKWVLLGVFVLGFGFFAIKKIRP